MMLNSKQQLIDSLTGHISLYHSKSPPSSSNPNPRSSILKWFSSLTIHQRQAHLTTVDPKFTQILLQMQRKLSSNGHGFFIVLPDIQSREGPGLPSLCYRRSDGLLARVSEFDESERMIRQGVRLFNSREGERVEECSCSVNSLDSMTVSEDFVGDVDKFVEAIDGVSNGEFLRGDENGLALEWVEFGWLKGKGYYSIEAFVANRLEVAMRLGWLNCSSAKKRGVKLKEKASAAGLAANVFWRKKGCIDWWGKLDDATRKKVFQVVFGKAAKSMIHEIVKGRYGVLEGFSAEPEKQKQCSYLSHCRAIKALKGTAIESHLDVIHPSVFGKPSSLGNILYGLFVLQDISTMLLACHLREYDKEKLFFSSLDAISSNSDCILRKLRGLLMIVSLDCTKLELLEDGDMLSRKKPNQKLGATGRRKKGKPCSLKRSNPVPRSSEDKVVVNNPAKVAGTNLLSSMNIESIHTNGLADSYKENNLDQETPLSVAQMGQECVGEMVTGDVQSAPRKNRRSSKKHKKSTLSIAVEDGNCQAKVTKVPFVSAISRDEAANSNSGPEISNVENISTDAITGGDKLVPNPCSYNSTNEPVDMKNSALCINGDHITGSAESCCGSTPTDCQSSDLKIENISGTAGSEAANCAVSSSEKLPVELNDPRNDNNGNCGLKETGRRPVFHRKQVKDIYFKEDIVKNPERDNSGIYGTGPLNSSGCLSYEWPNVAPVHFPSVNCHLPAATDRLHLDVGNNWQNHFRKTFVKKLHQVRNSPIENSCSGIVSRSSPLSFDWPPMVHSFGGLAPSVTRNYDSGFISRRQSSFQQGFVSQSVPHNGLSAEDERMYSGDCMDVSDVPNLQDVGDEYDNPWISEEEYEVHAVSGMDYSQFFGGGVMYWNPSDHHATSFSRPPSLSSDDSLWAWREADMNRAVDDMVAFSSSYSTNGLTSPSAASFCSPIDPLGPGHQALGYVISGSDVNGKALHTSSAMTDGDAEENGSGPVSNMPGDGEAKTGDSLPYPILRPIIIPNMSRERSRSDFKRNYDHKSPCVPPNRREQPQIKRPPSPVVLCVPRAPRPPPPSPVGDSRKHRGFPTVRSGSSSPRHWGVRGWFHDGTNYEEACMRRDGSEVVWPSWRNKSLSACPLTQPLPGVLLQDHLLAISQLGRDQEHPDVAFPVQPPELLSCPTRKASLSFVHSLLHDEIDSFCKQVASENLSRKPYISWAVKRVTRSLQVLWPRSRTNIFGSNATGLSLPTSDVDLVVCLPPVRNLEPIKEAGILEGRNGIKETCLQHAARYLANQEWVKSDSLKIVENTAIPIIMLVVEVPQDLIPSAGSNVQMLKEESVQVTGEQGNSFRTDGFVSESSDSPMYSNMNCMIPKDTKSVRLDISFKSPSHTGLQTTELVKGLTEQFPAATPLSLVLKKFLADRSLDQSYSGGLSSYCLILLITRFLQHEHHLGRPINQNFGGLLMDFLYFFGNVFDPRQVRVSVQGSGLYINRERGYSIDPIYIDDPLFPTNNVGRNCFRIHQCVKAFADAYTTLENELMFLPDDGDLSSCPPCKLLPKIIPSIGLS